MSRKLSFLQEINIQWRTGHTLTHPKHAFSLLPGRQENIQNALAHSSKRMRPRQHATPHLCLPFVSAKTDVPLGSRFSCSDETRISTHRIKNRIKLLPVPLHCTAMTVCGHGGLSLRSLNPLTPTPCVLSLSMEVLCWNVHIEDFKLPLYNDLLTSQF